MCLSFFEGKGYSDTFTRHMGQVQKMLEANPGITVAAQSDMICEKCPNLKEGQCLSAGKVRSYDKEVLARCNLQENQEISFTDWWRRIFFQREKERKSAGIASGKKFVPEERIKEKSRHNFQDVVK